MILLYATLSWELLLQTVNAENAKAVGTATVNKMVGKNVVEHSVMKNNQIVNMASNIAVKVSHELVNIDPQVLFQRLVTAGSSTMKIYSFQIRRISDVSFSVEQNLGANWLPSKPCQRRCRYAYSSNSCGK